MQTILEQIQSLHWSVGIIAALAAALLIARHARISSEVRTAQKDREMERRLPPKRGR